MKFYEQNVAPDWQVILKLGHFHILGTFAESIIEGTVCWKFQTMLSPF